nr:MAG TPA: hypothetical protein [Caudoviricetes sp.]
MFSVSNISNVTIFMFYTILFINRICNKYSLIIKM